MYWCSSQESPWEQGVLTIFVTVCLRAKGPSPSQIPWYQSGLAVISGRSFAWILMVYWTRDYPCAINQLNRQVASHPLNKSPLIFNKQAIASVKWIYRENFGDTSIAGLLMAYTGL